MARLNRRILLVACMALVACLAAGLVFGVRGMLPRRSSKWYERQVIGDEMDYQFYWAMSLIPSGMGDLGECLDTASRIKDGDYESWYREWNSTAERMRGNAETSLARGHAISAGEALLRAAAYYRMADFYFAFNPSDPRYMSVARKCAESYAKAIELQSIPMKVVDIPYEKTTLRGYLFFSSKARGPAPTILVQPGFDAWAEELTYVALAAVKRGYNCLLFNGPGQGMSIREGNLAFRPDWEAVVTPVVDFISRIPQVDPGRIALMGSSMGGALVTRAVEFEHRIKACVFSPGCCDLYDALLGAMPKFLLSVAKANPDGFDRAVKPLLKKSWGFSQAMYVFGAGKPSELIELARKYRYRDDLGKITCAALVMDGTAEDVLGPGQPKEMYDLLTGPKTYMLFSAKDVGDLHCQVGALDLANERMFDWLDEHMGL